MNHVWTTIAFKAPCSARHARLTPLLQLFNRNAKSQCSRSYVQQTKWRRSQCWTESHGSLPNDKCYFSTTPRHDAKKNKKSPVSKQQDTRARRSPSPVSKPQAQSSKSQSVSKLEPAPIVASHTEGAPEVNEPLTWRDYDPEGGMPLPSGELSQPEINAVFNSEQVDVEVGNYILCVMHWRRLSGALIDVGLQFPQASGIDRELALKGLQYVRTIAPEVDESAAGLIWAEEESKRMQEEIQNRALKFGLYKPVEQPEQEEVDQGTEYGRDRSGTSALQAMREEKETRWEEEQARKEVAQQLAEVTALSKARGPLDLAGGVQPVVTGQANASDRSITQPQSKAWLEPVERKPWVKYYEEQAQIIKENKVPQLSLLRRLGSPLCMVLLVLAGCYYLSENYTPPPKSARIWPDTPPSAATMYGITGVLLLTFVLGRVPPLWRTYSKYMTLVPAYPFALSLLGAAFRHDTIGHLAANLVTIWMFGLMLHEDVGRGSFLAIYLASGAVGGYSALVYNVLRRSWGVYIFGASGCAYGVAAAACALRPNGTIKMFGYEIPIAAWVILAIFGGAEVFAAWRGVATVVDHAGHVGAMAGGLSAGTFLRLKAKKEQATEVVATSTNNSS